MKIVFASDLHGRPELYRQAVDYARQESSDCVMLGGDLFPTRIANPKVLLNAVEEDFQICLRAQIEFIDTFLAGTFRDLMSALPGARILYIPGNHDWVAAVEHLERTVPEATNLNGRLIDISGTYFAGYACVTDSTFWVKDYVRRDRASDTYISSRFALVSDTHRLRFSPDGRYALGRRSIQEELTDFIVSNPQKTIFMFHCPPYDTGLDTLHNGKPIGSRSIRGFIERVQPRVSLHGHIHESPYMSDTFRTHIGTCLAVNPGHGPRALHGVSFDTDDPEGTLTHSLFQGCVRSWGMLERQADRRMRRVKSFLMEKLLRGR